MGNTDGKIWSVFFLLLHAVLLINNSSPGRYFAADLIKQIIAHIVLTYEIQPDGKGLNGTWFGNALLADQKRVAMVRRLSHP